MAPLHARPWPNEESHAVACKAWEMQPTSIEVALLWAARPDVDSSPASPFT